MIKVEIKDPINNPARGVGNCPESVFEVLKEFESRGGLGVGGGGGRGAVGVGGENHGQSKL